MQAARRRGLRETVPDALTAGQNAGRLIRAMIAIIHMRRCITLHAAGVQITG
jgi:hypothetical protein